MLKYEIRVHVCHQKCKKYTEHYPYHRLAAVCHSLHMLSTHQFVHSYIQKAKKGSIHMQANTTALRASVLEKPTV